MLALASAEFELGNIPVGNTVTVKWRGKPVFIKHRTPEEIATCNAADVSTMRDPEDDSVRVKQVRPKSNTHAKATEGAPASYF